MIYAVKCGKWIKFGKADDVAKRMAGLQCGNPYKLKLLAQADWADEEEGNIHEFLAPHRHKGEWFKDCIASRKIVDLMKDNVEGKALWNTLVVAEGLFKRGWVPTWKDFEHVNGQPIQ
jgi:hypothetical protein